MITVTLTKNDLLVLVKGTQPDFDKINDFEERNLGNYAGGHSNKWNWNTSFLKSLDEQRLWNIYNECRE